MIRINNALSTISLALATSSNMSSLSVVAATRTVATFMHYQHNQRQQAQCTRFVHLHGNVSLESEFSKRKRQRRKRDEGDNDRKNIYRDKVSPSGHRGVGGITHALIGERPPPDPTSPYITSHEFIEESADRLANWFQNKSNILCLTGAGISVDSGIPDYRGYKGSYHKGHKPMIHDQFMSSHLSRQRYWGRSMMGWKEFALAHANDSHHALTKLEEMGCIGVKFEDQQNYHSPTNEEKWAFGNGIQKLSIITQNVDGLHRKAGTQYLTELHGRNDILKCMVCGSSYCRHEFHDLLEEYNDEWIQELNEWNNIQELVNKKHNQNEEEEEKATNEADQLRPDGDAFIAREKYDDIHIPSCFTCNSGFYKPDVVFFGDSVPKYRVDRCYAAVNECDGLLCIGSSLAVHSAYRFVQHAAKKNIPICILNVGETRAEINDLDVIKIEAPASQTLMVLVDKLRKSQ